MADQVSGLTDETKSEARWDQRLEGAILAGGVFAVRHWLALVNLFLIVFVSLPLLAPLLMERGYTAPANVIYTVYRMTCHQEPSRSYFIAGPQHIYTADELQPLAGPLPQSAFRGSPQTGYKLAYCERDTAMYIAILLAGLIFELVGKRLPRLPLWLYGLLVLPLALDGVTQLVGLRESTWLLRTLTGGLFGLATAWLLFPELDAALKRTAQEFAARRARSSAP